MTRSEAMFESVMHLDIRPTPQAAFDHIARGFFEHHGLWDPSVTSMTNTTGGPVRVVLVGLEGRRFGPWSITSEIEVTAFEPDRRFGFRTINGPMIEDVEMTIEPRRGGSSLAMRLRLTPATLMLRVLEPLIKLGIARNVDRNNARMRAALDSIAEAGAAPEAASSRATSATAG